MSKVVLAVDGSENSMRAAAMAATLSRATDHPVDIVNVVSESRLVNPGPLEDYGRMEQVLVTKREALQSFGTETVAKAAVRVVEAGGTIGNTEVLVGEPATQIVGYAQRNDADCIVMGRRGLGSVAGLLMGSISHKVGHLTDLTLVTTK